MTLGARGHGFDLSGTVPNRMIKDGFLFPGESTSPYLASLLLVVWPGAPSSVLVPSSDALCS